LTGDASRRAAIVIPVFNAAFYTRVCLASLQTEQRDAEVIIVDNGSTDETPALLGAWADQERGRRFQRFDQVLGFARACNAGAAATEREFVVFLNNDTFVLEGWLDNLLRPFDEADNVQVTGSRLLYPSGHIQHAGIAFNREGPHHVFVGLAGDTPFVLQRRDFQTVTGAALAIRRAEFERLGGFDTSYQNSFEDVDLCLKVKRDGGRIVYVPDSVAYHFESMTEGRLGPTDMRNYTLFMERWGNLFEQDIDALHQEAVAAGVDLSQRVPSRREVVDREERLAGTEADLKELRRMRSLRSVRAALWARNTFRRVFPAS
jgi:GT2 family glycosyltransferase